MPPRQPLKLNPATGKAAVRKKVPVKAPPPKAAPRGPVAHPLPGGTGPASVTGTPAPAGTLPKPAKKSVLSGFSLYPDLSMAITMLEKRRTLVPAERIELIDKWLVSLNKVQQEMTHLRKLEALTNALARPVPTPSTDATNNE